MFSYGKDFLLLLFFSVRFPSCLCLKKEFIIALLDLLFLMIDLTFTAMHVECSPILPRWKDRNRTQIICQNIEKVIAVDCTITIYKIHAAL